MASANEITFSSLRAVLRWSPTGVVIYKTNAGWQVRKDNAALVDENNKQPRVWKDLDRAVMQLKGLGVRDVQVQLV